MATHSDNAGPRQRRFSIMRQGGATDGRPYFFEWLREIPADRTGRLFESRGENKNYELFRAIDGRLIAIEREIENFGQESREILALYLSDGGETYRISCGDFGSRWSLDIMKRLLHPAFDPRLPLRLAPFALIEGEKQNMGIAAMSGTDGKLTAQRTEPHLAGMPQPSTTVFKGRTMYDFSPVAEWLFDEVKRRVKLLDDPISRPAPAVVPPLADLQKDDEIFIPEKPVRTYTPPNIPQADDLPF